MLSDIANQLANSAIYLTLVGSVVFVALYSRSPWRSTMPGRSVMALLFSIVCIGLLAVLGIIFGPEYSLRPFARLATFSLLLASMWNLVRTVWHVNKNKKEEK